MPRITIYEQDNTGSSPVADLAVVFVPGEEKILQGKADAYGCVYIPSTAKDLGEYFEDAKYTYPVGGESGAKIDIRHLVQVLIGLNYGVIYMDVNSASTEIQTYTEAEVEDTKAFASGVYYILQDGEYVQATSFAKDTTYYTKNAPTEYTGWQALAADPETWAFLNDKNNYDIKFITTGTHYTVPVFTGADAEFYIGTQGTEEYGFNFELANRALTIPTNRKDCSLLLDLGYNVADVGLKANILAKDFKTALQCDVEGDIMSTLTKVQRNADLSQTCVSSRAYTLFSNCLMDYSDSTGTHTLTVPGSLAYLYRYANINNSSVNWLPISGVTRGVVEDIFTPDIELSKYFLDTQIISDDAGVSFNGIVNVRSYGYTIWGDRTLIEQDAVKKIQATSYFSLRNLVSDIAKTAYNSAIRYTYETNNDVTWLNFKQAIVTLLDQMVSSGVLQTYKLGRIPSTDTERNTMKALIKVYPLLPVENFEVYVNLENAEIVTTADDVTVS